MGSPAIFKGTKTQLLTQEGIKLKNGANKDILVGTDDPTLVAKSADVGSLYMRDGTDQVYKKLSSGLGTDWALIGTTSKDIFYTEDFESFDTAGLTTGSNATFLGGGAAAATPVLEIVTPMAENKSLKYTQVAGSLNDYFALPIKTIDLKQAGNDIGVSFYFKYSGNASDVKVVIYDATNSNIISSDLDLLEVAGSPTRYSTSVFIPSGVTQIRIGFHVLVENIGAILEIDDIEFSTNPFVFKDIQNTNDFSAIITAPTTVTSENSSFISSVTNTSTGFYNINFIAGTFSVTPSLRATALSGAGLFVTIETITNTAASVQIRDHTGAVANSNFHIEVSKQDPDYALTSKHVVTPAKSNLTDWKAYTPSNTQGFGTIANNNLVWRRVGDSMQIRGSFDTGTTTAVEGQIELPNSEVIASGAFRSMAGVWFRDFSANTHGGAVIITNGDTFLNFSTNGPFGSAVVNAMVPVNGNSVVATAQGITIDVTIPIQGWSSDAAFLAAIPINKVATILDVKTSGTNGGNLPTGVWSSREHNTIEGDAGVVSLTNGTTGTDGIADQFILGKGIYTLDGKYPARNVDHHKVRLFDVTNSSVVGLVGANSLALNGTNASTHAFISKKIVVAKSTTFRIEHRPQTGIATTGKGSASGFDNEVYGVMTITKIG